VTCHAAVDVCPEESTAQLLQLLEASNDSTVTSACIHFLAMLVVCIQREYVAQLLPTGRSKQ
jgi:hypothetical protein